MMRILLIILASYTLALSCLPCQDEASVVVSGLTQELRADSSQENIPHTDLCTPFCICSCCASVAIQHFDALLPDKTTFSEFRELHFSYLSLFPGADIKPVWQPPRA